MAKVGIWLVGIGLLLILVGVVSAGGIATDLAREEAVNLGNAMVMRPCEWDGTCITEYDPSAKIAGQTLWYGLALFGGLLFVGGLVVAAAAPKLGSDVSGPMPASLEPVTPSLAQGFCVDCGSRLAGRFCSDCGKGSGAG